MEGELFQEAVEEGVELIRGLVGELGVKDRLGHRAGSLEVRKVLAKGEVFAENCAIAVLKKLRAALQIKKLCLAKRRCDGKLVEVGRGDPLDD